MHPRSIVSALALAALLSPVADAQDLPPPVGAEPPAFGLQPQTAEDADDQAPEAGAPPEETADEEADADEADGEEATGAEAPAEDATDGEAAEDAADAPDAPAAVTAPDPDAPDEQVIEVVRDTFDDWQVRCLPDGDECFLYQLALDSDGNPVAEFSLVRLPAGGEAVAGVTVVTPLGTLLPAGLYMQVNGGELRQYPFTFCSQVGCFAQLALTQSTVSSLQRGRTARLVVASIAAPDEPVELDVSLIGFTAAYNSIDPAE